MYVLWHMSLLLWKENNSLGTVLLFLLLMRSDLSEEVQILIWSLKEYSHCDGEDMAARMWGSWSHCDCSVEAESRKARLGIQTPQFAISDSLPLITFPSSVTSHQPVPTHEPSGYISHSKTKSVDVKLLCTKISYLTKKCPKAIAKEQSSSKARIVIASPWKKC